MKTNREHRTERTAKEEYEILSKDIKNLAAMIAEKLEKDAIKDKAEGINWGHVGSLKHTKNLMKEILVFLGNNESEVEANKAIESELAKAR